MPRGGARPGAGRKKGQTPATKARKDLALRVASEGVTPLEIMTQTMRHLWDEATAGDRLNLGKAMQACAMAEKVAPYMHPKLASTTLSGPDGGPIQVVRKMYSPPEGEDGEGDA